MTVYLAETPFKTRIFKDKEKGLAWVKQDLLMNAQATIDEYHAGDDTTVAELLDELIRDGWANVSDYEVPDAIWSIAKFEVEE